MDEEPTGEDKRSFYKLDVHVWCTSSQLADLENAISRLLCPDPGHEGPCRIPWEIESRDERPRDVPKDVLAEIQNSYPEYRQSN